MCRNRFNEPASIKYPRALQAWLDAAAITSGPIFRRVLRGGHIGQPLSAAAVRQIVKKRSAAAGVQGEFTAHSLRSGFVTEAGRQQIPLAETMAMTGHRSVQTVIGYNRGDPLMRRAGARLLDPKGVAQEGSG